MIALRVLVTRPHDQGAATLRRLRDLGHDGIGVPLLVRRALAAEPPDVAPAALVVTSANAVPAAAARFAAYGDLPVFAVGAATARALSGAGFRSVVAGGGDGRQLARAIASMLPPPAVLLHVAGRDRRPEPERSLAAAGFRIATWEVYAMEVVKALPAALAERLRAGTLDAALHYSRRSAEALVGLAREAGLGPTLHPLLHACLSAEVAGALQEAGASRIVIADAPTEEALLDALDRAGPEGHGREGSPGARPG